jgi:hypothetical protein
VIEKKLPNSRQPNVLMVEPSSVSLDAAMFSSFPRPWIMRSNFVMRLRLSLPSPGFPNSRYTSEKTVPQGLIRPISDGTAEAVPLRHKTRDFPQFVKPDVFSIIYGPA